MQPQDRELIAKALQGDDNAFRKLHERYRRKIFNYLCRFFGNRELAEDVTQETFIQVYKHLRTYSGRGKLSSWIYQIATNLAKNTLRSLSHEKAVSLESSISEDEKISLIDVIDSKVLSPEDITKRHELGRELQKAINSLPPHYRSALILCEIQGLSYEEAAEILRCSVNAVGMRLSRAKAQIRNKIKWDLFT